LKEKGKKKKLNEGRFMGETTKYYRSI